MDAWKSERRNARMSGWMEWKGERMNGRMESMFDSGMDGFLGEKRTTNRFLELNFRGCANEQKKTSKKLEKVRKS